MSNATNSLHQKIRKLIESLDEADTGPQMDLESLSDDELRAQATEAGLDEMIIDDDEGGLANRDEIVQALEAIELNQTESVDPLMEADGDKEDEEPAEDEEADAASDEEPAEDEELPLDDLPPEEDVPLEDLEAEEPAEGEEADAVSDQEPAEDEDPEVTVVVVSPEFKKDDEEDEEDEGNQPLADAASLFGESLSPEERDRLTTVFESAVRAQVKRVKQSVTERYNRLLAAETKKLANSQKKQVEEAKKAAISEAVKLVDGFMSETTEQWMVENAVALEQNIRAELTEQFIDGLKVLFKEHYIEVPEEKFDLVKAQETKIHELEESVKIARQHAREALQENLQLKCEGILQEATVGMTETAKARFEELTEQLDIKSVSQFRKQVQQIAESVRYAEPRVARKPRQPIIERFVEQTQPAEPQLTDIERLALQLK